MRALVVVIITNDGVCKYGCMDVCLCSFLLFIYIVVKNVEHNLENAANQIIKIKNQEEIYTYQRSTTQPTNQIHTIYSKIYTYVCIKKNIKKYIK